MSGYMSDSKRIDWETPQEMFDELDREFHFDLDVASSDDNKKCMEHYTEETDGLSQDWSGHNVWCNPPYGRCLYKWFKKAYEEKNKADLIVMLVPAKTDTKWFHEFVYGKSEVRFIKGRVRFVGSKEPAPFPSMLVIYRK